MAYKIEGKDIVISGFEGGISESIYSGPADMRNVDIIGVPGEASVIYAETAATKPPVLNAIAYTTSASADTLTWANSATLYEGVAIVLAANTATGLSNSVVYYVRNIVGATFQVSLSLTGAVINITSNGSGTFTTYQYGNQRSVLAQAPVAYSVQRTSSSTGIGYTLLVDGSLYVWLVYPSAQGSVPANSLVFLGNIGGIGASSASGAGIEYWNGYIMLFGSGTGDAVDYAKISTLLSSGPAAIWNYGWQAPTSFATNARIATLVSQEDGNLYFSTGTGLGSIIQEPGTTFNPATPATYAFTTAALPLPGGDRCTCLSELGQRLLLGGEGAFVYTWDKVSNGFSSLLNIPDNFTVRIISTSQNAYIFSGQRGRIYLTNGSGIALYKKIPDYITGITNPYIIWKDANFSRNQLYFSFVAYSNANVLQTTVAGCWAIDLDSDALRLLNKTTNSGYTGTTSMVAPAPAASQLSSNPAGTAMNIGWYDGSTYGFDVGSINPYSNYESYIDTEMVPVGTFIDPFTPSQVEWKTSAPLVSGEGVKISYRKDIASSFTQIGETTTAGGVSDLYQTNFQQAQWVQFRIETKSTSSSPSFTRLTEMRIRDWPSGVNNR